MHDCQRCELNGRQSLAGATLNCSKQLYLVHQAGQEWAPQWAKSLGLLCQLVCNMQSKKLRMTGASRVV